jgi:D-cysteine desulfhydrase
MSFAALFDAFPALQGRVAHLELGAWPTPLEPLSLGVAADREIFVKREDASSALYGGNKVRTLESLLALAAREGAQRVWSTGAYGSNHALASALHAPRAGLRSASLLFPQPATRHAAENLAQLYSLGVEVRALRSIATFPIALAALWVGARRRRDFIMLPGGATPLGALGHVGAACELAAQIRQGMAPWPRHLLIACGSTCTAAGLMAGLQLAATMGLWQAPLPRVHALRVTPWPVTSRRRIAALALGTARLVESLGGPKAPKSKAAYLPSLVAHGRYLGWGYGRPTKAGLSVIGEHGCAAPFPLETTYSAKALAGLFDLLPRLEGPIIFWSTKSAALLPPIAASKVEAAPARVRRWLRRASE